MKCGFSIAFTEKENGTPSSVWKKEQLLYKNVMIYDKPANIPENIAPHLKSDIERFMYKQTFRAVRVCIDNNIWDNDYMKPQDMMKELLEMKFVETRAISKKRMLNDLDELLWNACLSLDIRIDIGDTLLHMEDIDGTLEQYEKKHKTHLSQIEALRSDTNAVEVRGRRGKKYKIDYDAGICTCLGYTYKWTCKHLQKSKKSQK